MATAPTTDPKPAGFASVQADAPYTVPEVAAIFRVSAGTIARWIKRGYLKTLPRLSPWSQVRILGSDIIAMLGERAAAIPGPTETREQRNKRAEGYREEARRLAGLKPKK